MVIDSYTITEALTALREAYSNEVWSRNVINIYCHSGCYRVSSDDLGVKLCYLRIFSGYTGSFPLASSRTTSQASEDGPCKG